MLARDVDALASAEHDLLVVGGGIQGAAVAWEAASRGLAVALVEAGDFASGASWNSLKTIHGGLRHLQRLDVAGLRESARERTALLRIAPRLVRPLPFVVPAYGHGPHGREALRAGLALADLLTLDRNRGLPDGQRIPRGRVLSRRELGERVPGLPLGGLRGGAVWTDAQVSSSERLVLAFLRSAGRAGARLANYVEAVALRHDGGRVSGVALRDRVRGREVEARARMVVLAAGAGGEGLLRMAGLPPSRAPLLSALNLVLATRVVEGCAVGGRHRGRFLFLVPWWGRTLVGTAYAAAGEPPIAAAGFLAEAREAFPWAPLEEGEVTLAHRGLVPGHGDGRPWTRSRLVDHEAADGMAGLLSIVTAKYTTARGLAEAAVDRAIERLGIARAPSRTREQPLDDAAPGGTLAERTRKAVREEMALRLTDVVLRRLDLGTGGPPAPSDLDVVAATMAVELGWDSARADAERRSLERFYAESLGPGGG